MLYSNAEKPTSGQSVKLCVWKMGFFVVSPVSTNTNIIKTFLWHWFILLCCCEHVQSFSFSLRHSISALTTPYHVIYSFQPFTLCLVLVPYTLVSCVFLVSLPKRSIVFVRGTKSEFWCKPYEQPTKTLQFNMYNLHLLPAENFSCLLFALHNSLNSVPWENNKSETHAPILLLRVLKDTHRFCT